MADDEQKLTIAISAVDNASAVLKELAGNVSAANNEVADSNEKGGTSFGTLVGSIVTAQATYEAFREGLSIVKDFLEQSVEAAMEESRTLVQLQVDVKNAGLSYATVGPQIDALAKKNEALGFTEEQTRQSMGLAVLSTGNYNDALKLNHLAMDLSVAKNMDLNQATTLLNQVMAGNTRVLKSYGISLDSATTSGEALNIVQGLVGGSAEALAGTPAGNLREFQAQWEGIQEEVGNKLMPILLKLFGDLEQHLPEIENGIVAVATAIEWMGEKGIDIFGFLSDEIGIMVDYVMGLGTTAIDSFKAVADGAKAAGDALHGNMSAAKTDMDNAGAAGKQAGDDLKFMLDQVKQNGDDASKNLLKLVGAVNETDTSTKKLSTSTQAANINFDDMANRITKADNAVLKHSDAISKLSTDYDKMKDEGAKDLASLSDEFTTKMQSINDSIAKTKQSIADLTASFNQGQTDATSQMADSIVASEQKIADIKKQLSQATTATERGQETDLQRAIDTYNQKKALDTKQYQEKLATLQQQLKDQTAEATAETTLYNNKVAQINKILDAGNAYFTKLSNERLATTTAEVNAEIAQFQALTAAINASKSASASALSTISIPSVGSPAKHEAGGFVNAPRGTAVPIIAHGGEQIIPAEQSASGNGGNITIQIINPSVRKNSDIDDMRKAVEDVFRSVLINHKIVHI